MSLDRVLTATLALAALIFLMMLPAPSYSQSGNRNDGHSAHHDVYEKWTVPGTRGMSCCSARVEKEDGSVTGDCRPGRARQDSVGDWEAYVDGARLPVPRDKVLKEQSPDGRSHFCGIGGFTFCFVPGEVRS